ncbi:MAG: hypothetical protein WCE64_06060 [Bacteroidales bacterium]
MKKMVVLVSFLGGALFPAAAQSTDMMTEEVPVETITLKKGDIPPDVIKTADEIFKEKADVKWTAFPFKLKKYGWEVDQNNSVPVDMYEVFFKTTNGVDTYAVFDSSGNLERYRTIDKDASLPIPILKAVTREGYKDWKVQSGTEIVTDLKNNIEEHYTVRLHKGNQKKILYFTKEGKRVMNE